MRSSFATLSRRLGAWAPRVALVAVFALACWHGGTVYFSTSLESQVPRTVRVLVGASKKNTAAAAFKVNATTGRIAQHARVGWNVPETIMLLFAEKEVPLVVTSSALVNGFGLPLAKVTPAADILKASASNRTLSLKVATGGLTVKRWAAALGCGLVAVGLWVL
ncbi:MAG: hypothetical protein ACOYMN_14360, partial [Roseimicrobium sp.]